MPLELCCSPTVVLSTVLGAQCFTYVQTKRNKLFLGQKKCDTSKAFSVNETKKIDTQFSA